MTLKTLALVVAAALALAACNEETAASCTAETAQAKMGELTAKITELGTSDPAKLEQFSGRAAELQTQFADVSTDPQAACDAIDALMAEIQ
jgi:outer membrane murein-binding lipoprotein Lpp